MRYTENNQERCTMSQNYTPEFKKKIVRHHEEEGRTYKSITSEYGVSKASISKWCRELCEECQTSPESKSEYDNMKELLKLKRENEELRKENLFLKKRRHSLQRKSIRGLSIHRPIP
ncbi:MAG: transposase [Lachnospiraceae bacterium]